MVKRKNRQTIITIGIVVALLLVASYFGGLFSFIAPALGEEGFEPKDVLLESNTYTPTIWNNKYETSGSQSSDEALYQKYTSVSNSAISLSGGFTRDDWRLAGKPTKYCREDDGNLFCIPMVYDLIPLEQEEVIIDFYTYLRREPAMGDYSGTSKVSVNGQEVFSVKCDYLNCGSSDKHRLEIRWNDYETNQYQVFVDGRAVGGERVATDGIVNIQFRPQYHYYTRTKPTIFVVERFDTRRLFGCDPQEGEVIADMTFTETTFDIDDLIGFKRFCTDIPSLYNDGGVVTSTNRIYYNLASGESVVAGVNKAYRIFYVADGVEVGALDCGSGESYSIDEDECLTTTGFASICSSGSILIDNVCVTKIIDEVDFTPRAEIVGDNTILWDANGEQLSFNSLDGQLFSVATPVYSCRETDGHDDTDRINYPQPSEDCWTFYLNDEEIAVGDTQQVGAYWSVSLESVKASLRYDADEGQNGVFEEEDDWGMSMQVVLEQPFVDISASLPSQLELGGAGDVELSFDNRLSSDVNGIVELVVAPETIDNTIVVTKQVSLPSGSSVQEVSLPTAYLGDTNTLIFFTLRTDAGNLLASDVYEASYEVVDVVEDSGTEPIQETDEEVDISQDNETDFTTIAIILGAMIVVVAMFLLFNRGKKGGF